VPKWQHLHALVAYFDGRNEYRLVKRMANRHSVILLIANQRNFKTTSSADFESVLAKFLKLKTTVPFKGWLP
jgi:hypothetical protein